MRDRTTILLEEAYDRVRLLEVALTNANVDKFNKKYQTNFTQDQLKDIFDRFNKQQSRLTIKDIFGYSSLQELKKAITAKSNKETQKSVKSKEANIIINNDRLLVVEPLTIDASNLYGANTKWCTAAKHSNKFIDYAQKTALVYIIDKKLNTKYAIAYYYTIRGQLKAWNQEDKSVPATSILSLYNIDWNKDIKPKLMPLKNKLSNINGKYRAGTVEKWYVKGKLDRKDGPAEIYYTADGSVNIEVWYKNGLIHRDDGPAQIEYTKGRKTREVWYKNGKIHRQDQPADLWYDNDGNKTREVWYKNGKIHKQDGPADIHYDDNNGNKFQDIWYRNGEIDRQNGPANIVYHSNGKPRAMKWYKNGSEIAAKFFDLNGKECMSIKY